MALNLGQLGKNFNAPLKQFWEAGTYSLKTVPKLNKAALNKWRGNTFTPLKIVRN